MSRPLQPRQPRNVNSPNPLRGGNNFSAPLLRGERLGEWEAVVEVAKGVLDIEQFNPMLRTEAWPTG